MKQKSDRKVLAIIQARMGSTRLPGKMMLPIIDGKGALELMIERVSRSVKIDETVVATTINPVDDPLEKICDKLQVPYFRGSEEDVLDRFYQAANKFKADVLVRLTGDSPLHDPALIDKVIDFYLINDADYVSNTDILSYPDGLEVEVFGFEILERIWKDAKLPSEREHVVLRYMRNNNDLFKRLNVKGDKDYSSYRLTLDEEQDYQLIKKIYSHFYHQKSDFDMMDIISFLEENPELKAINNAILRNKGTVFSHEDGKYIKKV